METIREAVVIDNNDPDKKGKVKVRILPEMLDFKEADLPWVGIYSMSMGQNADYGEHIVLENDSNIRVLIEDWPFLKRIRYISDDYLEQQYIYTAFSTTGVSEIGTQTYPQPSFKCYKDGTIDFHNSETGEHGVFFKDGGYFLVDATGNIYCNSKTKEIKAYNNNGYMKLTSSGNIELNGNADNVVTYADLNTALGLFKTSIESAISTAITTHVHTGVLLGEAAAPLATLSLPPSVSLDISASKATKILTP